MANEVDDGQGLGFEVVAADNTSVWRAVVAVLGISLWVQLFWYPLATEFLARQTGSFYVALYVGPVVVLFGALFLRSKAGFLFAYPTSMLPGFVVLPRQDAVALLEFDRAVFAAGTFVAYVVVSAVASRRRGIETAETDALSEPISRSIDGVYRYYVPVRWIVLAVLFAILVGAGVFDPSIRRAIATHHEEGRIAAQVFVTVFGFFVWCVIAYAMFFLPLANVEYDVRRLSRRIDQIAGERAAVRWRIGLLVSGGLALVAAYLVWQSLA